ncbi:MAG: hypothetical protein QM488_14670 [Rhizobiaceae bacterium]
MFTILAWMISARLAGGYATIVTAVVALVFFVFCSIGMLSRYYRDEVVLAVRQQGFFDKRLKQKIINWEEIKEIVLLQREQEFQLELHLWPMSRDGIVSINGIEPLKIDLEPFEIDINDLMQAINEHTKTRLG